MMSDSDEYATFNIRSGNSVSSPVSRAIARWNTELTLPLCHTLRLNKELKSN